MSTKAIFAETVLMAMSAGAAPAALLLQYNFDDSTNAFAADTGAAPPADGAFNGNSGRTNNTPSGAGFAMTTRGGAITNFVSGGDADKVDGLSQLTLSGWINLRAIPSEFDRLISDHAGTSSGNAGFDLFFTSVTGTNFQLTLTVDGSVEPSGYSGNVAGLMPTNTWVFFAVTYDGTATTNNLRYFLGDTESPAAQFGTAKSLNKGSIGVNTGAFLVAGTQRSTSDRTPNAFFDDIRVYDDILSEAGIESIRFEAIPEPATSLLVLLGGALTALLHLNPRSRARS